MQLGVGKSYTNCAGEIRSIVRFDECDGTYPFVDEHDQWYTKDGRLWYDCESEYDLIDEIVSAAEPSVQTTKALSLDQVKEMCSEANRGYCIEFEHYLKAVRDTERKHGIVE